MRAFGDVVPLDTPSLPAAFGIASSEVPNARELALGTNGTVVARTRGSVRRFAASMRDCFAHG